MTKLGQITKGNAISKYPFCFTGKSCRPDRNHLYDGGNRHAKESEEDTQEPLRQSERASVCKSAQKFDDNNLEEDRATEHCYEYIVI
ncbi:hypothetical protein Vadar_002918 [Vaccinium darrowii]|uniref:Uncharacterized protein n=1 Tax=Vaccinium darrowii TaxID=229202 RepID=A0ACB7Y4E9_9ERIC|nr:hypothetical protein Vadar_002918 [Vaccinium darrowii]